MRWKRGEEEKGMERVCSEGKRKGRMRCKKKEDEKEGEEERRGERRIKKQKRRHKKCAAPSTCIP